MHISYLHKQILTFHLNKVEFSININNIFSAIVKLTILLVEESFMNNELIQKENRATYTVRRLIS